MPFLYKDYTFLLIEKKYMLLVTDTNSLIISNTQIIGLLILIIQHKKVSASSGTKLVVSAQLLTKCIFTLFLHTHACVCEGGLTHNFKFRRCQMIDSSEVSVQPLKQRRGRKTVLINGKLSLSLSSSVFVTSLQA